MLEFRDVRFRYESARSTTEVLRGVSFACNADEIVAVVGPSGCGKSTLLGMAAGLRKPLSGEIVVNGRVADGPDRALGILFQHNTLFPWRSVQENVELGLEVRGVAKRDRRARGSALIEQYGLAGFERKYPHALSGGMQKRVALIQTLAMEPEILLLDEPFGTLDAQTRLTIEDDVVQICRTSKRAMLLVTHDIAEAISIADRIVVLTKRPATVKAIFDVPLSRRAGSVHDVQGMPEFSSYFREVWDALDISLPALAG